MQLYLRIEGLVFPLTLTKPIEVTTSEITWMHWPALRAECESMKEFWQYLAD